MQSARGQARSVTWSHPSQAVLLFLRGVTARTAVPVAAVVGTVLSAVNQGDVVLSGTASPWVWVRIAVNYLVPFLVASFGYLSAWRSPRAVGELRRGRSR